LSGGKLIFDIRGFLADEYVDSGNWRADGLPYRLTKRAERWLYRAADGFVVLTEKARAIVLSDGAAGRPVEVIPCCVDQNRFAAASASDRDAIREEMGLTGRTVLVYAGALGGYYLINETAELFAAAREDDPRAFALVLTQGSPAPMSSALAGLGFSPSDHRVIQVEPDDVPRYLRAADVALALVRPSFARQAMSPTKFAEYLAAGLPVIATSGIGDLDAHIEEGRVGVLLETLNPAAYSQALQAIKELRRDPGLAARCRAEAHKRYDLQSVGGERYRRLYDTLINS
jgi:glycosyltransferase involved in cell wall biosynthesis